MSKSKQALAMLKATPERSLSSIARELGITVSAISMARKKAKETAHKRCPHCGSKLRYMSEVFKD